MTSASCEVGGEASPRCECGAPPRCGSGCSSRCGCCGVGPSTCSTEGIVRTDLTRNCYEAVVPCSGPDRCVIGSDGPMCAESKSDCETVRAAYQARLERSGRATTTVRTGSALAAGLYRDIQCPQYCIVSPGHCAQGLDTCWFLSYGPDPELDRLAALYQELGCPSLGPCICSPAPDASCQDDSAGAAGSYQGPLICTVL